MEKRRINEKLEIAIIDGQAGCYGDCNRSYWASANAFANLFCNKCEKKIIVDAVYSTRF